MTRISLTHIQCSKVFIKCGFSLRSCVSRSLIFAEKFHSLNISPPCPQPWLKPISIKFCSYTTCVKHWTGCAKLICSTSIGSSCALVRSEMVQNIWKLNWINICVTIEKCKAILIFKYLKNLRRKFSFLHLMYIEIFNKLFKTWDERISIKIGNWPKKFDN